LGEDSYIGELSTVQACAGHRVSVGRACRISQNVRIYTETSDADCDFRTGQDRVVRGDVWIGDGVWIGANAFIGPGINVGDNSVVGANSVVTADIPVGQIWGGVPARFIRAKRGIDKQ
jgi:maltose O-acetyltransferase